MKAKRVLALMVSGLLGLAGCSSIMPASQKESEMNKELTWQEAKATTQAVELEIADLIPKDVVVDAYQADTGMMLSCSKGGDRWNGGMIITVAEGTDIEAIVRDIEAHYENTNYSTENWLSFEGRYHTIVKDPETEMFFFVGEGLEPNQIDITSSSECFILPEGVYRGGDF